MSWSLHVYMCVAPSSIAPRVQADWVVKDRPPPQEGEVATAPFEGRWVRQPLPVSATGEASGEAAASAASAAGPPGAAMQPDEVQV